MPDWTASMQQTFEYYIVDPGTWRDKTLLTNVKKCKITRDSSVETLGSATIDVTESVGECYIRAYLITNQNGVKEKFPLGTFLVQTPSSSFNGKIRDVSMDAYTPLMELKENPPPLGYSILKEQPIMSTAYRICREQMRAPVVGTYDLEEDNDKKDGTKTLFYDFVADPNDTWITFLTDLIANAKYQFDLDEMGRVMFSPKQEIDALQAIWTFDDGNSSILYPDLQMDHDLYGIPNVVEVVYSKSGHNLYSRVVNDDTNSPTSTVNRGREIVHRDTNPDISGNPTQIEINDYANKRLRELSSLEYKVTFTHAYCPVRVGDCVRLDYKRAGISNVRAKIVSQTISCEPGCPVSTKAVFTNKLWG